MNIDAMTVAMEHAVADSHFYFRGTFSLPISKRVVVKLLATNWFEAWVDGEWVAEGPARFDRAHPEYEAVELELGPGGHVLSMHVHYEGVFTRIHEAEMPLFVFARIEVDEEPVAVEWRYLPLEAYRSTGRRIDFVLGWVEWCQTERLPRRWKTRAFDVSAWHGVHPFNLSVEEFNASDVGSVPHIRRKLNPIGKGALADAVVSEEDPVDAFMTRKLKNSKQPSQGYWMRFDLGKVRLGRPEIRLSAPPGTIVQVAYAESLTGGRVSPRIAACVGGDPLTCNLDHFVLRGGRQTLKPLHPKGGRFLELHIIGTADGIEVPKVVFEERTFYGERVEGSFSCKDERLAMIWRTGVETLRSCSEDAIVDNPTRERGQWLGDVIGPGMDILACSYSDLRPLRRGLLQSVQCAGPTGMIPAVFPGEVGFLSSFAIQWIYSVLRYFEISGDREVLESLYPAAERNMRSFDTDLSEDGLCMSPDRWNFVDWGYKGSSSSAAEERHDRMDPALSLFYLKALRAMVRWAALLDDSKGIALWKSKETAFQVKMKAFLRRVDGQGSDWEQVGYHTAALALDSGLLETPQSRTACVDYIKSHILSCFPNDHAAPRLHDPTVEDSRLITPFFAHHVFPALIDAGEMDFVLDQFRSCWGWALDEGLTTWPEVFDTGWSHCHQWSGCPTWILSRYVLGLHPRFDLGEGHYVLQLETGDLDSAEGMLPVPYSDETIWVFWKRTAEGIRYRLETSAPVWLHLPGEAVPVHIVSEHQVLLGNRMAATTFCELV